ncbi:sulfate transporter [Streptomyces capoamus]|uniref:Sulfate transporter n=1 Tax=Streptomyces capoamus TaxID=68183 RepID=A0A919EYE3_9ACTN|nr:STAS domain-containing protein [Streptomyces capoamus]GGW20020.1 sulfate transporter [Streptomyces libani subsp. rufus]GHG58944.1 sulfate transporter [Streptomyces capoamus]
MTNLHPTEFTVTVYRTAGTLTVRVAGELDYDTSDGLTDMVTRHLTAEAGLSDLRLDFRGLTWIDSTGLTALLTLHRRAAAVGATLHLDHRPDVLERMLRLTNVLEHLTAPASRAGTPDRQEGDATGTSVH